MQRVHGRERAVLAVERPFRQYVHHRQWEHWRKESRAALQSVGACIEYSLTGETRYSSGTIPTTYLYTGQRRESSLGGLEGLYFYGARWLDPALGRFTSPDSIIPEQSQGVQAYDRYAYANNNAVKYTDPTGHMVDDGCRTEGCDNRDSEKRNSTATIDSTLGGNSEAKSANPPLNILLPIGWLLTGTSLLIEGLILYTEVVVMPTVVVSGGATVILELTLAATGIAVLDANIAYWSYVYRVAREPDVKQPVELFPPWGFGQ
jgi:RHS repeat-associated protein